MCISLKIFPDQVEKWLILIKLDWQIIHLFNILCNAMWNTMKMLLLLRKYNGCLKEKPLYNWVWAELDAF